MRAPDAETRIATIAAALAVFGFAATSMFDAFTLLRGVTYPALLAVAWAIGGGDGWERRRDCLTAPREGPHVLPAGAGRSAAAAALALAVLAIRSRVLRRHGTVALGDDAVPDPPAGRAHSNRDASPAPYLAISATPEVKSTTVVGSEPASPSMTASSS
jgi:hypothetical protein